MRKGPIRDSSHGRTLAKGMHQIGRPVAHGTREEVSGSGRSARSQVRTSVISRLPRIDPLPICGTLWQWFSSCTSLAQVDPRVQHALKVLALRKSRLATVFHLKDFPHLFSPISPSFHDFHHRPSDSQGGNPSCYSWSVVQGLAKKVKWDRMASGPESSEPSLVAPSEFPCQMLGACEAILKLPIQPTL